VNTSYNGLVLLSFEPEQTATAAMVSVTLRRLKLSLAEPDDFVQVMQARCNLRNQEHDE
jgi:hypothetical protein